MNGIREKLFAIFQAEHAEHLEQIRSILALIEKIGGDAGKEQLDDAFRRAHSLKGAARAVDLNQVEGLAGRLETLFSRVREGSLQLDTNVTRVVRQVLDSSEDCLAAFRDNRVSGEPDAALRAIEELLGIHVPNGAPPSPANPEGKSAAASALQPIDMVRLPSENLDRLVRSTGRILTETLLQHTVTRELAHLSCRIAAMEAECSRFRKSCAAPLRRLKDQPEFSAVDGHMTSIQQNLHSLAGQARTARRRQQHGAWKICGSAEQLQRDVWSARMAPADELFEAFRKMVRDLARDEKKEIEFRLQGSGVRADRMVLQSLKDPVMHLLRNAISHGIETPRERESKGKSAAGSLILRLDSQRGRLIVGVEDDGRGVDFEKVAKVAVEQGMLSGSEPAAGSAQELARFLFRAGFSTSATVNDLSGRGMGLSVVYETVRRLQGEVDLEPKNGPGASIVLSVPLSVLTHHLLFVSCRGQTLGIPTHGIERLHRVKLEQLETVEGRPVVNLNGRRIALFSLAQVLRIGDDAPPVPGDILPVLLLRSGALSAALWVDGFLAQGDALIQDLGMPCPSTGNVSGGVLLREGTVCIVLNPAGLMTSCTQSLPILAWNPGKQTTQTASSSILVVDDSITTRSLEKSILEAHGYRVRVAVDGVEALELLRAEKADLIITDIQMPRLDGFGLLEALRADKRLDSIPVIIVTSVERAEDQQRGLLLGADSYVVKRKFDQQELLDAIRQIL